MTQRKESTLSEGTVLWGAIVGFIVGAIYALLKLPRSGQALREEITTQLKSEDPIERSLTEGKAIARQRRQDDD